MAMDGWASLGAALAGGGGNREAAYTRGAREGVSLQSALLKARQERDAEVGRQAAAREAFEAGDNELGNAILQGFGSLAGLNTYAGGRQERGFKDEAMGIARQPNADVGELNRMLMVMSGKPFEPTRIQGNTILSTIDPNIAPQTTELGRAMMASEFADAGAANARAAASYASAGRSRAGIAGDKASNYELITTPNGVVRVNKLTGEAAPLLDDGGAPIVRAAGAGRPLTADQANAAGFAERMDEAQDIMTALEHENYNPTNWRDRLASRLPTELENLLISSQGQKYNQAAANFVRGNLRKESGAAIGDAEMAAELANYLPALGDEPGTVKQKAAFRNTLVENMRRAAGPATRPADLIEAIGGAPAAPEAVAVNPATGQRLQLVNGQWVPL